MSNHTPFVLLVDDDTDSHFLHSRLIRRRFPKARVASVSDGRQALRYLMQQSSESDDCPTHLWLDLNMPTMDGWNFLEALAVHAKKITCRPRITIVSSSPDVSDVDKANQYGVSAFVQKFMDPAQVESLLTIN